MHQPVDEFDPPIGPAIELDDGLRRILAPNASPMTYRGTNTYLLGKTGIAVIDPGPDDPEHLGAILAAIGPDQHISHIIVTHTHVDHSPLAHALSSATGAPVLAYGHAQTGRSAVMTKLAQSGLTGGGEGIDVDFKPDQTVQDGEVISGAGWSLEVIHTPGHLGNHIALGWGQICFTADHVMGWASSLVSPPDGDLTDFMDSCHRLRARDWHVFHAGHGAPITDPSGRLDWLIAHRVGRETEILSALSRGPATAHTLARMIYTDTPLVFLPAAERNVLAHLIDLIGKNIVSSVGPLAEAATFQRLDQGVSR
jgi:glyoxylase-like metal-dependent hydrolase (beta-lactamase superfamily II)